MSETSVEQLDHELTASAELDDESPIGTRYQPEYEGDDLDIGPPPLAERDDGDEFKVTSAGCCGRCAPRAADPFQVEPDTSLASLTWKQMHGDETEPRLITLDLSGAQPRLHTAGVFIVNIDLLAEILDRVEDHYREAA